MIALAIAALVITATIATALTLVDSWLRARHALAGLRRERALLAAGFVPQIEQRELRLRQSDARGARGSRPSLAMPQRRGPGLPLRDAA
jgi:hypothetical protein